MEGAGLGLLMSAAEGGGYRMQGAGSRRLLTSAMLAGRLVEGRGWPALPWPARGWCGKRESVLFSEEAGCGR